MLYMWTAATADWEIGQCLLSPPKTILHMSPPLLVPCAISGHVERRRRNWKIGREREIEEREKERAGDRAGSLGTMAGDCTQREKERFIM